MRQRNHALYCTVICTGPLIMIKRPEEFMAWGKQWPSLRKLVRVEFRLAAKNVHVIEPFVDPLDAGKIVGPNGMVEDPEIFRKLDVAFAGSHDYFAPFNLIAWDPAIEAFRIARLAKKEGH